MSQFRVVMVGGGMKQTGAIKLLILPLFFLFSYQARSLPFSSCGRGGESRLQIPEKEPLHKQMPGIRLQPGECVNSFSSAINTRRVSV